MRPFPSKWCAYPKNKGFPGSSAGKEACRAGNPGSATGLGSFPGEGIGYPLQYSWASLVAQMVKESTLNAGDTWVRSLGLGWSPGGGHGKPLQYSCLENPHGQRSLVGYSPCKESDTTEWLITAQPSILRTRTFSYITTVQYDNIILSTICRSYSDFSVSVRSFIEEESPRSGITFICRDFFVWKWSYGVSLSFMTVTILKTAVHFEKCLSIWIHLFLWN